MAWFLISIMKMKFYRSILLLLLTIAFSSHGKAQVGDTNSSVQFEVTEDNFKDPSGFELPAVETPKITNNNNPYNPNTASDLGKEEEKPFDMTTEDGLLDNKTDLTPKYFTKDKTADEKYGRDQNLGEFSTGSQFLKIMYRDHEAVDGDLIRVFVNGDVVQSRVSLISSFKGISVILDEGVNVIEFQALNQGDSGPNTAELHVYDDNGQIISAREWNLLTGYKARVQVIKE